MSFDPVALRREFPLFAARPGGRPLHYLDNAAMAQIPRSVIEAVVDHETTSRANVHRSLHLLAERADTAYETARATIARHLHAASPTEVVFTAGTTAAINLVALAIGAELRPGDEVVVSHLEHHSNLVPWLMLEASRGAVLRFLPVTAAGRLDPAGLASTIGPRCRMVALTHGSNVTGAIPDLAPVVAAARAVGARILLDGAQTIAHGPVNVGKLGVDFYAFSGHKVFGPTGVGVLWGREAALRGLAPPLGGGGMVGNLDEHGMTVLDPPHRFEAGTPPVAQAIGLAEAMAWLADMDREEVAAHERRLTQRLIDELPTLRGVRLVGPDNVHQRLPVVSFTVAGHQPEDICQRLAGRGIALRGGSHCAQPLMKALGLSGTVRASLAPYNGDDDIDALLDGLAWAIATKS